MTSDAPQISKVERAKRAAVAKQREERDAKEEAEAPRPIVLNFEDFTEPLGRFIYGGETHEYVNPSARGLLHQRRQKRLIERIAELEEARDDPSDEEEREYGGAVRLLAETVTDLTADQVRVAELVDLQEIIGGFFGWREFVNRQRMESWARTIAPANNGSRNGASSSRGSTRNGPKRTRTFG